MSGYPAPSSTAEQLGAEPFGAEPFGAEALDAEPFDVGAFDVGASGTPRFAGESLPAGPSLLLVAHGTRDPAGAVVTEQVAARARRRLGVKVAACYVDVRSPSPAEALERLPGPVVAVPMFLAAGYHVRTDVPAQLHDAGRSDVLLAETFGPSPTLLAAAAERLRAAGLADGDAVILAVAGSSDPSAQADGAHAARRFGRLLGRPVTLATVATGGPRVADAVAALRAEGAERVAVASWLLAPGLVQRKLHAAGADVVASPLADHPAVVELVAARYAAALSGATRTA